MDEFYIDNINLFFLVFIFLSFFMKARVHISAYTRVHKTKKTLKNIT